LHDDLQYAANGAVEHHIVELLKVVGNWPRRNISVQKHFVSQTGVVAPRREMLELTAIWSMIDNRDLAAIADWIDENPKYLLRIASND
jgi:hypothetical protein